MLDNTQTLLGDKPTFATIYSIHFPLLSSHFTEAEWQ